MERDAGGGAPGLGLAMVTSGVPDRPEENGLVHGIVGNAEAVTDSSIKSRSLAVDLLSIHSRLSSAPKRYLSG